MDFEHAVRLVAAKIPPRKPSEEPICVYLFIIFTFVQYNYGSLKTINVLKYITLMHCFLSNNTSLRNNNTIKYKIKILFIQSKRTKYVKYKFYVLRLS